MSKAAFLFPGQGAQTVGMGRWAYENVKAARELFDRAGQLLGYDLAKLCCEGPAAELDSTVCSQPALFVCGLAALEVLRERSPDVIANCQAAAGLSLGEYTALVFAGVMDFESGLSVVQKRGEAMQAAADTSPGAMVSVLGMEVGDVQALCDQARGEGETLQIANFLCPGNVVISGDRSACDRATELVAQQKFARAVPLAVAGAFHTSLMQSAVARLAEALAGVKLSPPRIPVVSNVDASAHSDADEIREVLIRQLVSPVRWDDSMRCLLDQGVAMFYEMGPGRVLRGLLKRIQRKASCEGVDV